MLSATDPAGNTVSFTYDTRGRKLTETNPDSEFKWWSYDALGQVLNSSQSPKVQAAAPGNAETYIKDTRAYDNLGRVRTRTDGDISRAGIPGTHAGIPRIPGTWSAPFAEPGS